jgi:invasion protein IalB
MFCLISRLCGVIVLAGLFAAPAASEESKPPGLIYAPWTKLCIDGTCLVASEARSECGLVVAAMLFEKDGEAKKTLHVTLPARMSSERGVRIIIDQGQPIIRPYIGCYPFGCTADYEGGAELVEQLKQGQMLFLEGMDEANSPINLSVPLLDFARAYDGPQHEPHILEEVLSQKEREQRKRDEEARKMRCEGSKPLP